MEEKAQSVDNAIIDGPILKTLTKLSLPIVAMSLFSILYNLVDIMFIGKIGDDAVSGVAATSFYASLGLAILTLAQIGTQILVAQKIGEGKSSQARSYYAAGMQIALGIAVTLLVVMFFLRHQLVWLTGVRSDAIFKSAEAYFIPMLLGFPFLYTTQIMVSSINGAGDTRSPFYINSVGLVLNIILNPILIFGLKMGVVGSSLSTLIAQIVVFSLMFWLTQYKKELFSGTKLLKKQAPEVYRAILKIGLPNMINRVLFSFFSIVLANIITSYGEGALGVQRIGIQLESFTWMVAQGVASAMATFVGQNYGAKKYHRIKEGYLYSLLIMGAFGLAITLLFVFLPGQLFGIFVAKGSSLLPIGIDYMKIVGLSEVFMTLEFMTNGVFNGLGRTIIPSVNSIIFTGMRIPIAMILVKMIGIDGVWWSISATSIIKGVISFVIMLFILKKLVEPTSDEILPPLK